MRLGIFVGIGKDPAQVPGASPRSWFSQLSDCGRRFFAFSAPGGQGGHREVPDRSDGSGFPRPRPACLGLLPGPAHDRTRPEKYRRQRIDHFKRASDFARQLGIPAFHTHNGFIPENPNDPVYGETVKAIREVAPHCKGNNQIVLYETGQESPTTMLRCIQDVGVDNQFVNLDTANLILYGNGNPVDALDVIGKLVRGVHAKDGLFPTDPRKLGQEVPIGQGKVDFPTVIKRLKQLGYTGAITIEREISGPKQSEDIKKSKAYLERLIQAS